MFSKDIHASLPKQDTKSVDSPLSSVFKSCASRSADSLLLQTPGGRIPVPDFQSALNYRVITRQLYMWNMNSVAVKHDMLFVG